MSRRFVPAGTMTAIALFIGAAGLWGISIGAPDPALAYAAAPPCSSAVVVHGPPCRRQVAAVVADISKESKTQGTTYYSISLSIAGGSPVADLELEESGWAVGVKKGDEVTATVWSNRVTAVTNANGTAEIVGNFPDRAYPAVSISIVLLVIALLVSAGNRARRLRPGLRVRVVRGVDRLVVPALAAAVIAFYVHRAIGTVWGIAAVGTVAEVSYLTVMSWQTTSAQRVRPQPRRTAPIWTKAADEAKVPVDPERRAWIEESMHWFEGQFGKAAAMRDIAVPAPEFFPADYAATPGQIHELFVQICGRMEVDSSRITLLLPDGIEADGRGVLTVGRYRRISGGSEVVELDAGEARDPAYLAAVIAHELGHARLLGEDRIAPGRADGERLTDLLTVYLGFGVINANAALVFERTARGWSAEPLGELTDQELSGSGHGPRRHLGYLSEAEFGYAMACLCRLREDTDPAWASYLEPGPRVFLRRSLAALRRDG